MKAKVLYLPKPFSELYWRCSRECMAAVRRCSSTVYAVEELLQTLWKGHLVASWWCCRTDSRESAVMISVLVLEVVKEMHL